MRRVTLTTDTAACVRACVDEGLLLSSAPGGSSLGLHRRLLKAYHAVLAAGFSHEAVQAAFRAAAPRAPALTAEVLLDWLCLQQRFPLPAKLAVTRAASTGGEVMLLALASEDAVSAPRLLHQPTPRLADEPAPADEAAAKEDVRNWVRNYVETVDSSSESEEEEHWSRRQPPSATGSKERRELSQWGHLTEPAEAREPLGTALARARGSAKAAKVAKDADAQREAGALIKTLKMHMDRLGLSEDECLSASTLGAEEAADLQPAACAQPAPEEAAPGDEIGGMFDEDSPLGCAMPKLPRNKKPVEKASVGKRGAKLAPRQAVQEVLQLPKALLQQHCLRQGWPAPRFERQTAPRSAFRYSVVLECTHGKRRETTHYELPEEQATRGSVEEAQNAASCCALFAILPEQPLHLTMPTPYRDLWLVLQDQDEARKQAGSDEQATSFIAALLSECKPALLSSAAVAGEVANNETRLWRQVASLRRMQPELHAALLAREASAAYQSVAAQRASLPICAIRTSLADELQAHDALVVCGETGCGKTTQVPQFVLDDATLRGEECSVIVTQPRRVAAISIAERVASERLEMRPGAPGALVGYQVRQEAALTSATRLLFCTTGILLRRLHGDALLAGTTHVILDEVHERSLDVDLLLTLLRDVPARRAAAGLPALKLVLMSATINASLFSAYLGGCPVLCAEGRTFPVRVHFLEDVYQCTGYLLPPDSPAAFRAHKRERQRGGGAKGDTKEARLLREGWGDEERDGEALNPGYKQGDYSQYSERVRTSLSRVNEAVVDYDLLEELLAFIHDSQGAGAILVFMPGIREVNTLTQRLCATRRFSGDAVAVLPLHSALSSAEQRRVFQVRRGVRKVVVATNIAETSLTLEDVVFVVDTGRQKCRQYNPKRGLTSLEEEWVSRANAKQRQGRAGRVRAGEYYALYTRHTAAQFRASPAAEMQRIPLTEAALHVAKMDVGRVGDFFSRAPDPPVEEAVLRAVATLKESGAMDEEEALTALGHHLANLPMDINAGKVLLYGALMGCARHALTMAAFLSSDKSPFLSDSAERVRAALAAPTAQGLAAGQCSDHLVMVDAFEGWRGAQGAGGARAAADYCRQSSLCPQVLGAIAETRRMLADLLARAGFLPPGGEGAAAEELDDPGSPWNANARSPQVVKESVLCAALAQQLAVGSEDACGRSSWLVHAPTGAVVLHPSSVAHGLPHLARTRPFLLFQTLNVTSQTFIRDVSAVSPAGILLFGGTFTVQHVEGTVTLSGGAKLLADAETAVLIKALRLALQRELALRVAQPASPVNLELLRTIARVLRENDAAR